MSAVRLIATSQPALLEIGHQIGDLIAYCARVSNPANQINKESNSRLLNYLIRNQHWSPFEMVSMTMEIKTTRDIARQILRHRSFSFQEFSQRYAAVVEPPVISEARLQDAKNRQASIEVDDDELQEWWHGAQTELSAHADRLYAKALDNGIAKEIARKVLPEGLTPSTLYMAGTIRSWIHYVMLRTTPGTQKEHRNVAEQCKEVLLTVFPDLRDALIVATKTS